MSSETPHVPTYPVGLRLAGRRVLVVGGGSVAQRRVPGLIAAGAAVEVVAPQVTPAIEGLVGAGEVRWERRGFEDGDLEGAWYVLAATDDPEVNARVGEVAEAARVFCVRADDAAASSAFTPATGSHDGATVAVLGRSPADRDPRRHARLRDDIVEGLRDGSLGLRPSGVVEPSGAGPVSSGASTAGATAPGTVGAAATTGHVVLVGGGPGDPELISVAGRKALMAADVVVADRLAPRELLGDLPSDTEIVDVAKLPRGRSAQQAEINRIIVERALEGLRVVRFKGGDSFVFGRGYEEVEACREAGVPVTVVPGISSPLAVPAVAGIPVTHRGVTHEFTVVSGHLPPGHPDSLVRWEALAGLRGTVVLMMAVENAPLIAAALLAGGRGPGTPVAVVCDGTMATQRTVLTTLGGLAEALTREAVQPPAVIVVGDVVAVAHPEAFGEER